MATTATVITSTPVPYGATPTDNKRNASFLLEEEEGIFWLRGQFIIGSVEVDAALTAQALETKKP